MKNACIQIWMNQVRGPNFTQLWPASPLEWIIEDIRLPTQPSGAEVDIKKCVFNILSEFIPI